jgi:ribonuclease-3
VGLDGARAFVERTVIGPTAQRLYQGLGRGDSMGDHKSALQEMLQAKGAAPPEYDVKAESGPDHRKRFLVEVVIPPSPAVRPVTAQGTGTTKKRAEQEAARVAFQQLHEQDTAPIIPSPEDSTPRKTPALDEEASAPIDEESASPAGSKSVIA